MSRFVLTAQLQLQAPNNVAQVVRQIQSQLNNVNVNVQVQGAAQAQRQLQQVTAQTQAATTAADRMGRAFAVSIRRFAAFSIATRAVGLFTSTLSDAIKSAIDFEREMVRVSQVTGQSIGNLKFLTKAITDLSTGLGVSSKDLLNTGQLLLQAGISAKDTEVALKTLAKAALAPNFDSLSETTEGAIAILAQFQEGVGALEKQLGAINAVAGAFAVEAGDLIDVIRRAGGVFKSSGGDLNELIALFTSVRATTRESAESIGTGLRTIFTRIQRPKTIEFLKQFGVELVDLEGKFVGPFEAVKRLSTALSGLGEGDITFIRIAEELGGFRQIGKVLPLLQQFSTAQAALNVANKAGNSLTQDAATAQQALAIRILKVKEEFLALVRSMTETSTFQIMANTALSLASALIQIGEAIKPLLPLLAAVAAVNFARGISGFAGGLMRGMQSGRTYSTGGKVHHFARGGMVPGTGNRDTVPAMLQPGEFVIRKSSVNKLGASNLAAMNENRLAKGGKLVKDIASTSGASQMFKNSVVSTSEQPFRQGSAINPNDMFHANLDWKPISKAMVENDIKNKKVPSDTLQKLLSQSNAEKGDAFETYLSKSGRTNLKRTVNPIYPVDFTSGIGKYAEAKNIKTSLPDSVYLDKLFRARVWDKSYSSLKETPSSKGGQNIDLGKLQVFYRKFAEGGLVNEQNIGAAILESTGFNSNNKFTVSRKDIESKLPKILKLNEQYPIKGKKTLTLQSEGLSGATYEKFKSIIDTNLISAAEDSAIMLGSSLGLAANKSIPANESQRFLAGVNDASVGNLFEDTLKVLSGPPFSSDPQRSFDFTNGLSNILKDDYRNLTSKYIDAKSSSKRASTGWETKIANTLASEAISNNFTRTETQEEKKARESSEFKKDLKKSKLGSGGIVQKFAVGGEAQKVANMMGKGKALADSWWTGMFAGNNVLFDWAAPTKAFKIPTGEEVPVDQNLRKILREKAQREWMAFKDKMTKERDANKKPLTPEEKANLAKYSVSPEQVEKIKKEAEAKRAKAYVDKTSGINWDVENSGLRRRRPEDYIRRSRGFATGGGVGTDTIPALLTPGEFVVNRSSAQSIGYGNLNRMNKVGRYAKGGVVQRFSSGTTMSGAQPSTGGSLAAWQSFTTGVQQATQSVTQNADSVDQNTGTLIDMAKNNRVFTASIIATAPAIIQGFLPALDEASSGMLKVTHYMLGLATTLTSVMFALEAFGVSLSAKSIMQLFGSGPGGLGSLIKNAFSGFKMGAAGMAGQQPLGGGIASRIGGMFGAGKASVGNVIGSLNNTLDPSLIKPSFSLGRQGKSLTSMTGDKIPLSARLGNFAGRATQGMNLPNLGVGKALSGVSQRLAPYTSAIPTGFRAGFAGKKIVGGNMLSRGIGGISSGFGTFGRGVSAGLSGKSVFGGGSKSILGNLGGLVGQGGFKIGGLATKAGGLAARAGGAVASGLGGAGSAALSMAGPIAGITGFIAILNGAVGAFKDLDGQLQKSIQAGKVEEASKLAVAKAAGDFPLIGNLVQGLLGDFGDELLVSAGTIFGGPTLNSVKALAASQAGAVKTQKQLEQAQKTATHAMEDFENGSISASEALSKIRAASNEVINQEKRASDFATKNLENRASDGFTGRNVASFLTFGMVESSAQRNERLGKQSAEQINQATQFETQRFQMESGARSATIRSGLFGNQTKESIRNKALGIGTDNDLQKRLEQQVKLVSDLQDAGDKEGAEAAKRAVKQLTEEINQVNREINNLDKEVQAAKDKFAALNLGFRSITAAADASALRMEQAMSSFDLATIPGVSAMKTLEASLTAAGQNISKTEFDSSLSQVTDILKKFGADNKQVTAFTDLTKGVAAVQRGFPDMFETLKERLKGGAKNMSPEALGNEFKKIIGENLDKAGIGEAAKKRIMDSMGSVKFNEEDMAKIMAGDVSVLEKYFGDAAEEVSKNVKGFMDKWISANQELITATQQRIEAERNLVAAQKEAVDLYMEGREVQAKYGGVAVTSGEKRAAILAKANAGATGAGISNMRTGSVAELRARNAQIAGGFFGIESRRGGPNAEMGARGTELEGTQQNLQQAQKDQIETIRALIKLEEEELKIIQEKNRMEKDSLESLISGDIDKFFEQQAAVGAQAAIATGDMTLANQFGSKAVGDAFKDIQRQQEAGVQSLYGRQLSGPGGLTEQAAGAALASRGVMDPRMAQTLAGTTPEEAAAQRRLQDLGGVLGETGAFQQAMAEMQVQTAQMKVERAELVISNLETGGAPAQGLARGGVVYANRGMFVPRGTDTVPAMLTPGEFVVRRESVNRGNNLQLLEAINNNTGSQGFARGGKVGYYNNGGKVQYKAFGGLLGSIGGALGIDPQLVTNLGNIFNTFVSGFNESIKNLQNTKLQVKLDSVNVNVNLNGTSMLTQISEETRNSIMEQVVQKIQNEYSVGGPGGKLIHNRSNLGRP
jgi:TP901 family phage tail tape measure protein